MQDVNWHLVQDSLKRIKEWYPSKKILIAVAALEKDIENIGDGISMFPNRSARDLNDLMVKAIQQYILPEGKTTNLDADRFSIFFEKYYVLQGFQQACGMV